MTEPRGPAQPGLTAVIELARHAPSVHNTQPWAFSTAPGVLTLHRDVTRRLPVLDPDDRQLTLSCGAALHLARLGLRVQGFDADIDVVRADSGGLEVRITATAGSPATDDERALAAAAVERHTQRGRFEDRPVTDEHVSLVRTAALEEGAWVRVLVTPEQQLPLAVLLARADEAERLDPAYRDELAAWTGRPADAADGLVAEATAAAEQARASDLVLRRFDHPEAAPSLAESDDPPPVEHPLVVVIGTDEDTTKDWLLAGQALSALLVRATALGLQASPLGQAVDQPWGRRRLAGELGVVGHPQMVLRVGYGQPGPVTPRRTVDDLVT